MQSYIDYTHINVSNYWENKDQMEFQRNHSIENGIDNIKAYSWQVQFRQIAGCHANFQLGIFPDDLKERN